MEGEFLAVEHFARLIECGGAACDFAGFFIRHWLAEFGFKLWLVVDAVIPSDFAGRQVRAALGEVETDGGGVGIDQVAVVDSVSMNGGDCCGQSEF